MSDSTRRTSSTIRSSSQGDCRYSAALTSTSKPGADTTLTSLMRTRHSARAFLPTPVPHSLLQEVLQLAQQTASNSNCQPWHVKILTGGALQRLSSALLDAVKAGVEPTTEPIPEPYDHYRSESGHLLYGPDGYDIAREDKGAAETALLRNYAFFNAPVGLFFCMDKSLADVDLMCVGMYMQSLSLLLAERGVACCWQVSVAGYPNVVRTELKIGDEMLILSGGAMGYEDLGARPNGFRTARDAWREHVSFFE
ncbi:oxidoreductase [Didymella exigua CBS 183.55]|uniref:Oxidoreductase n=1 Tax=Didymella exigua CBS 183.55 TaxID=1150837 RepID=A0A6A5S950_9PLEO|nr:oxidoreductase [Didymella exigua CBS 183.55]KAF1933997.1 oxidoreductase [Didymella exigua CBS 183.55]